VATITATGYEPVAEQQVAERFAAVIAARTERGQRP
jgi:hypothetical protein